MNVDTDGKVVKLRPFDDKVNFNQNMILLKFFQKKAVPLSFCEEPALRDYVNSLDPKSALPCYKSMQKMQSAQRATLAEERRAAFEERRNQGHRIGFQFDGWTRHGHHFLSLNYTYLELGEIETDLGMVPAWIVKSAVLDFVVFTERTTAENMSRWLDTTIEANGLTWSDVALLAADGASNCVKTFKIVKDDVEATVCFCHDIARSVLTALGFGAALDFDDEDATAPVTEALRKMRTLAVKFHKVR